MALLSRDFLRGRRRRDMAPDEQAALEASLGPITILPARTTITRAGEPVRTSSLLLDGLMCRYMDARDGQRQLVALQVPGDFVDLHGFPLQRLDHDLATITECRIASVPHERLVALTEQWPHLGRLMWFSTLLDAAMHREWIFRIGRLPARGRIAHLLSEIHARLAVVDRAANGVFDFPVTQQDLGEACGLTSVHVNRTLAGLRRDGLVTVRGRSVTIHDVAGLARVGEFEPGYLYLTDGLHTP